jgi:hypothetical protein
MANTTTIFLHLLCWYCLKRKSFSELTYMNLHTPSDPYYLSLKWMYLDDKGMNSTRYINFSDKWEYSYLFILTWGGTVINDVSNGWFLKVYMLCPLVLSIKNNCSFIEVGMELKLRKLHGAKHERNATRTCIPGWQSSEMVTGTTFRYVKQIRAREQRYTLILGTCWRSVAA